MREVVLCMPKEEQRLLLGLKKRGFGVGKYTGFGGGVEAGETLKQAMVREIAEETGLVATEADLLPAGQIIFHFPLQPAWDMNVNLFGLKRWQGRPVESEEIRPVWFDRQDIPYDNMWDDALFWLHLYLREKRFRATFTYAADNRLVGEADIRIDGYWGDEGT